MSYAKQKETKIEDSNIALYGSDLHRSTVEAAANLEVKWAGSGQAPGVRIWRVENKKGNDNKQAVFGINDWPKKMYGTFYDGDSYIILKTVEKGGDLVHDIFFWIGQDSTQDERGVAAYKAVELDDFLGGMPTQTRIMQGNETKNFISCFAKPPKILDGGIEGGFNHVKPEEYKGRLLHVKGKGAKVRCVQVPMAASSMNKGDCYLLDVGTQLYQWNGPESGGWEKRKAHEALIQLRSDRELGTLKMKPPIVMDDNNCPEFWEAVGGTAADVKDASEGGSDAAASAAAKKDGVDLYVCSDADGSLDVDKVEDFNGVLEKSDLKTGDVFIIDKGTVVYVWVGKGANKAEKRESMMYAERFLAADQANESTPVIRLHEGADYPNGFKKLFKKKKKK